VNEALTAGLLGVVLCGALGLFVPRLVAAVPEPEEAPEVPEGEPPKELYADVAALPRLAALAALLSAVAGGTVAWGTGLDWSLVWLVPVVPVLVALAVVDWRTRLLPKVVVNPTTLVTLGLMVVVGVATGRTDDLQRAVLSLVAVFLVLGVLWFVHPGGLGYGDVRLGALLGLVLGWVGWGATAVGVVLPFVVQGLGPLLVAIVTWDRSVLKRHLPFGPFMVLGAVVALVWGTEIAAFVWG